MKNFISSLFYILSISHITCLGEINRELVHSTKIEGRDCILEITNFSLVRKNHPLSIVPKEYLNWSTELKFEKCSNNKFVFAKWFNTNQAFYNEEKDIFMIQSSLNDLGPSNIRELVVYTQFKESGFKNQYIWDNKDWSLYPEVLFHKPSPNYEKIAILSNDSYDEKKVRNFRFSIWNYNMNQSNSIEIEPLYELLSNEEKEVFEWLDLSTVKIKEANLFLKLP